MVAGLQRDPPLRQTGRALDLRKIELQLGRRHRRHGWKHERLGARQDEGLAQAIDLFLAGDEALEAVFVAQVEADQDRGGEADRQARDGDGGVEPVAREVSQRCGDVVLQHGVLPSGGAGKGALAAVGRAAARAGFVGGPTNREEARGMAVRRRAGFPRPPGRRAAGWCAAPRRHGPASG